MSTIEAGLQQLLSKEQAAILLGISTPTLNRRIAEGKIKYIKIGQAIRFEREAITAYQIKFATPQNK